MKNVREIIDNVKDFPTLPTIYNKLMEVIDNPNTTVNDLANIISRDQSSSTKILKAVNSPVYALKSRIDTISQAIFHLGFDEVKNLIITLAMLNMFSDMKPIGKFRPADLWKHSIAVGVITRFLGKHLGVKKIENYFLSGIMHDIGKLFFIKYYDNDYVKVINFVYEHNISIRQAEKKIFGASHTAVGGLLADKWRLPNSIKNSIEYHTEGTFGSENDTQTACVHIANIVARALELGNPGDNLIHQPNILMWKHLQLPPAYFVQNMAKITKDYEHIVSILLKQN